MKGLFVLIISFSFVVANCQQPIFSLAIDGGVIRSFKKGQQFWAIGQTITGHFSLTPKNGAYIFLNYFINGKFKNNLEAISKSPITIPQEIPYVNKAKVRLVHLSVGWKRYLFGAFDKDTKNNLYVYGGLGLMMGKVENTTNVAIDTADYTTPVTPGEGNFKRLTVDLGVGYERPVGGDMFIYVEGRTLVPITNYPSPYLLVNGYTPLNAAMFVGIRIMF
jgi:hypothetical protein